MLQAISYKRKGFTLVEMLIVVTIIAILATSILVGLGGARKNARNTRRLADLKNIQNGLELYYNANEQYCPNTGRSGLVTCFTAINLRVPSEPLTDRNYYYTPTPAGGGFAANQRYILGAKLEVVSGDALLRDSITGTVEGNTCGSCDTAGCFYCTGP